MTGSKYFGSQTPAHRHLVKPGSGVRGEIFDLRQDIEQAFLALEGDINTYVSYPAIRVPWYDAVTPGNTPTAPAPVEAGPTFGWLFVPGNYAYIEFFLHPRIDKTKNLIVGLAWAPADSAAGKKVNWALDIGFMSVGKNLAAVDDTISLTDVAVPDTAATYEHTAFTITPSMLTGHGANADEIHARLSRSVNASDPALPPGIHHFAVIQYLS